MKTALVSSSYLNGVDRVGNNRLIRTKRYINYYSEIRQLLAFDRIILLDNASDLYSVLSTCTYHCNEGEFSEFDRWSTETKEYPDLLTVRFRNHLEHTGKENGYPYCWRALDFYQRLIDCGYKKIITIDTDFFVLTYAMAKFIRDCNKGWFSFLCRTYDFPESAVHILNEDSFSLYTEFMKTPWEHRVGTLMEKALPFTDVRNDFVCGRYGELNPPSEQNSSMDLYGQAPLGVRLEFGRYR